MLPVVLWRNGIWPARTEMPAPARWSADLQTFVGAFSRRYPGRWVPVPWAYSAEVHLCQCSENVDHCNIIIERLVGNTLRGQVHEVLPCASRYSISRIAETRESCVSLLGQPQDEDTFPPLRNGDIVFVGESAQSRGSRVAPSHALHVLPICFAGLRKACLGLLVGASLFSTHLGFLLLLATMSPPLHDVPEEIMPYRPPAHARMTFRRGAGEQVGPARILLRLGLPSHIIKAPINPRSTFWPATCQRLGHPLCGPKMTRGGVLTLAQCFKAKRCSISCGGIDACVVTCRQVYLLISISLGRLSRSGEEECHTHS